MQVFSVLSKPVDFNVLLDALARVLRRYHENRWPGEGDGIDWNFKFEITDFKFLDHTFYTGASYGQASSSRRQDPRQARRGAKRKTKAGIVLPDTAKEKPKRGKSSASAKANASTPANAPPSKVKKGDEVIFASYAGTEIKLDGEELMIMSDDDVLAVVES